VRLAEKKEGAIIEVQAEACTIQPEWNSYSKHECLSLKDSSEWLDVWQ